MYVYYQAIGGSDEWHPCQAKLVGSLNPRPTFVTVLALDVLVTPDMPREAKEKIRYQGPLYFDLDSDDVVDSINGAVDLVTKLEDLGLTADDMCIYLSGKKGVHITIPQDVFMERPAPLQKLPAIYKELAFHLAVDTLDFAVYTASRGRMFRTSFNVRENGNYKVRITKEELRSCVTQEEYNALCKTPRADPPITGKFRAKLGLLFDAARQKVTKIKQRKIKPVSAKDLERHHPTVARLMAGEVEPDVGFNKIAIQLALYARAAGMSPAKLVEESQGLISSHVSDSQRYNTPAKRERELRRMCEYVEDNSSYDYAIEPIKAMVKKRSLSDGVASEDDVSYGDEDEDDSSGGVFVRSGAYWVQGQDEGSEKCILAGQFMHCRVLNNPNTGAISCLVATFVSGGLRRDVSIERADFSGSAVLHKLTSQFGVSFLGSDINARGIYELMLRNVAPHRYVTEKEGLDVVRIPTSPHEEARNPFVIWADYRGVRIPKKIADLGIEFQFQGYPDPEGVIKTDLSNAPAIVPWLKEGNNKDELLIAIRNLMECHSPDVAGKMIGWHIACFWRQLFHEAYGKFPLLHVNGPAGSGKTEYTEGLLHFFYWNAVPRETTPSSSVFAILSLLGGSASIPILVDEYKPQEMTRDKHNQIKLLFRDAYNKRDTTRGGGNRSKDNYGALTVVNLSAPIVFVAEAVENETALLERTVLVTIKRNPTAIAARNYARFREFFNRKEMLAILGANIAAHVTSTGSIAELKKDFDAIYDQARKDHLLQPGEEKTLSIEEYQRKANGKERLVYNHSVALFGLHKFELLLRAVFRDQYVVLSDTMEDMKRTVFSRMEDVIANTMPEYLKVICVMSDMTRLDSVNPYALVEGKEYNLIFQNGIPTLHIAINAAYSKYRAWMRVQGATGLYANDVSFMHSLQDSPQFLLKGAGTKAMKVVTAILDYDALQRAGVPAFAGKVVTA